MIQEFEARFKPQWFGLGFLRSGKLAPRSIEPGVVDVRQLELFYSKTENVTRDWELENLTTSAHWAPQIQEIRDRTGKTKINFRL